MSGHTYRFFSVDDAGSTGEESDSSDFNAFPALGKSHTLQNTLKGVRLDVFEPN